MQEENGVVYVGIDDFRQGYVSRLKSISLILVEHQLWSREQLDQGVCGMQLWRNGGSDRGREKRAALSCMVSWRLLVGKARRASIHSGDGPGRLLVLVVLLSAQQKRRKGFESQCVRLRDAFAERVSTEAWDAGQMQARCKSDVSWPMSARTPALLLQCNCRPTDGQCRERRADTRRGGSAVEETRGDEEGSGNKEKKE